MWDLHLGQIASGFVAGGVAAQLAASLLRRREATQARAVAQRDHALEVAYEPALYLLNEMIEHYPDVQAYREELSKLLATQSANLDEKSRAHLTVATHEVCGLNDLKHVRHLVGRSMERGPSP